MALITLKNVTKIYRRYPNPFLYFLEFWGSKFIFNWLDKKCDKFVALQHINLNVKAGERVGIIGRNGAGKTTLLRIIKKTILPTSGVVLVNGKVSALMQTGSGLIPELSGKDNLMIMLKSRGWRGKKLEQLYDDIVEFIELGSYLDYPVKTYSAGMRARLLFALATAVDPDILIIDEVLGAGDAYFTAKSADRIRKLVERGRALLLVSHSSQQILEFCERVVWLEKGQIVMDGDALSVVKAYEEFIYKLRVMTSEGTIALSEERSKLFLEKLISQRKNSENSISKWLQSDLLRICSVQTLDSTGNERFVFYTHESLTIKINLELDREQIFKLGGQVECVAVVVIFSSKGEILVRHVSPSFRIVLGEDSDLRVSILLNYPQLLLGKGDYYFSVGLYRTLKFGCAVEPYEIHSRSYQFKVESAGEGNDPSMFLHPAGWELVRGE